MGMWYFYVSGREINYLKKIYHRIPTKARKQATFRAL